MRMSPELSFLGAVEVNLNRGRATFYLGKPSFTTNSMYQKAHGMNRICTKVLRSKIGSEYAYFISCEVESRARHAVEAEEP